MKIRLNNTITTTITISVLFFQTLAAAVQADQYLQGEVDYDRSIDSCSIEDLRNVRYADSEKRKEMFAEFCKTFSCERAIENIKKCKNSQVIFWSTNYFGSIYKEGLKYCKEQIFRRFPDATFWLVDLKGWCFLSTTQAQLLAVYKKLAERIVLGQQLSEQECPLFKRSDILTDDLEKRLSSFSVLRSSNFFAWLKALPEQILNEEKDMLGILCKDKIREESLSFSLKQLGFEAACFNQCTLEKFGEKSLSEVDFSLIFPVPQYLEGIYYVCQVVKKAIEDGCQDECTIIFLIPNKEFTYYCVPGEKKNFERFQRSINYFLEHVYKIARQTISIKILFQPFAFGNDFYDAPYKIDGGGRYNKANQFEKDLAELL